MRIQHNLMAKNGSRQLSIIGKAKATCMERLSSGYRINSAADDAAGLAISEKMRGQIRGLNQASDNIETAISLIQTAEGGMAEVQDILHRMKELHVQAANDVCTNQDREQIQEEIDNLVQEVDRIGRTTEFNGMKILDGNTVQAKRLVEISGDGISYNQKFLTPLANLKLTGGGTGNHWGSWLDFKNIDKSNIQQLAGREFNITCSASCPQTFTFRFTNDSSTTSEISSAGGRKSLIINIGLDTDQIKNGTDIVKSIIDEAESREADLEGKDAAHTKVGHANGIAGSGSRLYLYALTKNDLSQVPTYSKGMGMLHATDLDNSGDRDEKGMDLWIQTGANSGQGMWLEMPAISSFKLGIKDLSVLTQKDASKGLDSIDEGLFYVNHQRARMGAYQNRLEHAQAYVDIAKESLTDAESRIRDADMAEEMSKLTKFNILEQAAQSMLTQANQSPNGILSLLNAG